MSSDIGIAQSATLKPIGEVAARLGIPAASIENYGHCKAKIALDYIDSVFAHNLAKLTVARAIGVASDRLADSDAESRSRRTRSDW